jgi:hypothetical protein
MRKKGISLDPPKYKNYLEEFRRSKSKELTISPIKEKYETGDESVRLPYITKTPYSNIEPR